MIKWMMRFDWKGGRFKKFSGGFLGRKGGTAKSSCNVCAFVSKLSGKLMIRAVLHSVVFVSL